MKKIFLTFPLLFGLMFISACTDIEERSTQPTEQPVQEEQAKETKASATVALDKSTFAPEEAITILFEIEGEVSSSAWFGLVPEGTPHNDEAAADKVDVAYAYLDKAEDGVISMNAPEKEGEYELRLFSADEVGGKELYSTDITVSSSLLSEDEVSDTENELDDTEEDVADEDLYVLVDTVEEDGFILQVDRTTFIPGEEINVMYTYSDEVPENNAWIGLIPSTIEHGSEAVNDQHDLAYEYLFETEEIVTFTAPTKEGFYDIRMHDSDADGLEVVSLTIQVAQ